MQRRIRVAVLSPLTATPGTATHGGGGGGAGILGRHFALRYVRFGAMSAEGRKEGRPDGERENERWTQI